LLRLIADLFRKKNPGWNLRKLIELIGRTYSKGGTHVLVR
jgi:hypothetical protein